MDMNLLRGSKDAPGQGRLKTFRFEGRDSQIDLCCMGREKVMRGWASDHSRPRVLAILPAIIPSTEICVLKPLVRLHRARRIQARITLEYLPCRRKLGWADVVVFCRNFEPPYAYLIDLLMSRNIPFIYDLDDNFFEIPLNQDGRYYRNPERLATLTRFLKSAELVRVYSEPLREKAATLNQKVEKVLGPIDWSLISSPKKHPDTQIVKIVYATSRFHDDLYMAFLPALHRVLMEYPERVEAHFWGVKPPPSVKSPGFFCHPIISSYDGFMREFSRSGYDIGLAPLPNDIFHRSKTNNKFREYGACRIAGIYSNTEVYSSCVTDGESGLLVSDEPHSWYTAMKRLIEDPPLRERIKDQAEAYVRTHYSEEGFENVWMTQILEVLKEKEGHRPLSRPMVEIRPSEVNSKETSGNTQTVEPRTRGYLRWQFQRFFGYLRQYGPEDAFTLLRVHLYGYWLILKLRFRLWLPWGIR